MTVIFLRESLVWDDSGVMLILRSFDFYRKSHYGRAPGETADHFSLLTLGW